MGQPKYIATDTETGGLNWWEHPLLTAYFILLDENFEKVDDLSLAILPYGDRTTLTEKAMEVNGIDILKHNETAISHIEAAKQLTEFFKKHKSGNSKLTAIGQNLEFDRGFIFGNLIDQETWNKYCIRGYLDTKRIADWLVDLGLYPSDKTSLEKMVIYFEVPPLDHHNAKNDTILTVEVYKKLRALILNGMKGAGQIDADLLESIE